MKKKLFSILAIGAIAITSCKKEEVLDLSLGDAIIKGNVYSNLDYSNDLVNGSYVQGAVKEGVEGMAISVEVNTYYWDQSPDNNYDYAKKTYTTTTDENGDYELTIPATDQSYNVNIKFAEVVTSRALYTTDGSSVSENIKVNSFSRNISIFKGAALNITDDRSSNTSVVVANSYEYGVATIRGTVTGSWDVGLSPTNSSVGSPIIGRTLKFKYTTAPQGMGVTTIYTATIDSNGEYSVEVPTNKSGNTSFVALEIYSDDFIADQIFNNGGSDANRSAIYSGNTTNASWFYDADIKVVNFNFSVSPL